ncbi:YciI family protein [Streptomyces sp. NPDC002896]|uniref:YciI family protein n=1 Tax=Streptomyces sp. NPDC002896 TaxID=3154438 RepID=UPI00331E19EC
MPVFAVTYTYTDDTAGRDEHRPAHKEYLNSLAVQGVNLCSGPFGADETPGALLLISAATKADALDATEGDPFRRQGLVADVSARAWTPMLGRLAPEMG